MRTNMNTVKLAQQMAQDAGLKAYKYDLFLREFDNMVELVGLVNDPTLDIGDFDSREMLFPKKWVTLKTFFAEEKVPA
jgi:hypothetical protein